MANMSGGLILAFPIAQKATAPPGFASEAVADSPNAPHEERTQDDHHHIPDFPSPRNHGLHPTGVTLLPPLGQIVAGMTTITGARASPAEVVSDLNFRRHVERVHALGARAVGELLSEIGAERAIQHLIDRKVERYADLDPSVVRALGGDQFATPSLTVVASTGEEPAA